MATKKELTSSTAMPDDQQQDLKSALGDIDTFAQAEASGTYGASRATFNMVRRFVRLARGAHVTFDSRFDIDGNEVAKDAKPAYTAGYLAAHRRSKAMRKPMDEDSIKNFGSSLQTCIAAGAKNKNLLGTLDRVFNDDDKNLGDYFTRKVKVKRMFGAAYALVRAVKALPENAEIGKSVIYKAIDEAAKTERGAYDKAKALHKALTLYVNGDGKDDGEEPIPEFTTKAWKTTLANMDIAFGEMDAPVKRGKDGKAKKTKTIDAATKATIVSQSLASMSDEQVMAYLASRKSA
jgi:hypothetical protein